MVCFMVAPARVKAWINGLPPEVRSLIRYSGGSVTVQAMVIGDFQRWYIQGAVPAGNKGIDLTPSGACWFW